MQVVGDDVDLNLGLAVGQTSRLPGHGPGWIDQLLRCAQVVVDEIVEAGIAISVRKFLKKII